jgi:hypothetical protein
VTAARLAPPAARQVGGTTVKDPRRDGRPPPTDRPTDTEPAVDVIPAHDGNAPLAPTRGAAVPEADTATNLKGEPTERRADQPDPPAMETAVLGQLEGLGILVVLRDAEGNVVAMDGTWRPADEVTPIDELRRRFPEGSTTTYAGKAVESHGHRPADSVDLEVVVTGHGHYEHAEGQPLRLVRFQPRELG